MAIEPALRPTGISVTWKQLGVALLILPLIIAFVVATTERSQGGTLGCDRASNRCVLDNGWLIHDRAEFPADSLRSAKLVRVRSARFVTMKVYAVEVMTAQGGHRLGGVSTATAENVALAASVDGFAKDTSLRTLDVRVAASTTGYVLATLLVLLYGAVGLAFFIGWLRRARLD